jgi:flagellar M-ring protein FliF
MLLKSWAAERKKIPYQLTMDGTGVRIPYEKIYETRLELASQGLPRGTGIGFEVFDDTQLGMTEFVQNVNYQRAIQGELSRTINTLMEVESSGCISSCPPDPCLSKKKNRPRHPSFSS